MGVVYSTHKNIKIIKNYYGKSNMFNTKTITRCVNSLKFTRSMVPVFYTRIFCRIVFLTEEIFLGLIEKSVDIDRKFINFIRKLC